MRACVRVRVCVPCVRVCVRARSRSRDSFSGSVRIVDYKYEMASAFATLALFAAVSRPPLLFAFSRSVTPMPAFSENRLPGVSPLDSGEGSTLSAHSEHCVQAQ